MCVCPKDATSSNSKVENVQRAVEVNVPETFSALETKSFSDNEAVSSRGKRRLRRHYSNFQDQALNESDLDFEELADEDSLKKSLDTKPDEASFSLKSLFKWITADGWKSLNDDTKVMVTNFICGGVAGATAKTFIAPFDRSKLIFQTTSRKFGVSPLMKFMRETVKRNGVRALWRGHSLTLARTFPYAGIQFMAFERYKKLLMKPGDEHLSPGRRFIAGSLAGTTASMSVYPLEVLRSRMAVQDAGKTGGIFFNARLLLQQNGIRGFYMGAKPALVGMLPYAGLAFGTFETLKIVTLQHYEIEQLPHVNRVVYGALSGLLAQTVTYPLDTVRRRMQTEGAHNIGRPVDLLAPVEKRYTGILQTLRLVAREEGFRTGLFKGVSLNWFKGPIALGISFSTYDALKAHFSTPQEK